VSESSAPRADGGLPDVRREEANLLSRLDRVPVTRPVYLIALLLVGAWVVEAFDIGVIGTVILVLKSQWSLTPSEVGFLGVSSTVGIVIGLLVCGRLVDRYGRKKLLLGGLVWFCLFTLITPLVHELWWILLMRLIAGLGEGVVFTLPYLMLGEIVNKSRRNTLVGLAAAFLIASYVLPSLVGAWSVSTFSPEVAWQVPLIVGGLPILFAIPIALWIPESPRWLLGKGRITEVRAFVERLEAAAGVPSDPDFIDEEQMRALRAGDVRQPVPSRLTVFRRPYLRRTLASWAPWTGMTLYFYAFLLYGPSLLVERGLADNRALLATGIMMATAGIGTFLQGYLADRIGRKPLLWSYGWLGAVGLVLLGYVNGVGSVLIAGFLAAFFGLGVHGVTKIYIAEQYPTSLRGTGAGMAEGICRFLSGVLAAYYIPFIFDRFGVDGVFWIVAVVAAVSMLPMIVLGRETRGLSVEETGMATADDDERLVVAPERQAGVVGVAGARSTDG
jgi:putative MFS transporter